MLVLLFVFFSIVFFLKKKKKKKLYDYLINNTFEPDIIRGTRKKYREDSFGTPEM